MTTQQKHFIQVNALYNIATIAANTFVTFYIWQSRNNFQLVILYSLFVFVGIGISGLLSGLWAKQLSSKLFYILSCLFYVVQLMAILTIGPTIGEYLTLLGLLNGIAIGSQAAPVHTFMQLLTTDENRKAFLGLQTAGGNLINLVVTPLLAILIDKLHSYSLVFGGAVVLFLLAALLCARLAIEEQKDRISLRKTLLLLKANKAVHVLLEGKFLFGIQDGLFWVTLGVVTLEFLGNLSLWGIFAAFLKLLLISCAYLYGKYIAKEHQKYFAVLATILFGAASILLTSNWNTTTFIIYQIVQVILVVMLSIDLEGFYSTILDEPDLTIYRQELNGLSEVALNIGRLIPVVYLLLFQVTPVENIYLKIAYVFVAFIPLQILSVVKKLDIM